MRSKRPLSTKRFEASRATCTTALRAGAFGAYDYPSPPSIEDIDDKATTLADSANKFKNSGASLKRHMRCRLIKMYIFFGILIVAILGGIIAYFV